MRKQNNLFSAFKPYAFSDGFQFLLQRLAAQSYKADKLVRVTIEIEPQDSLLMLSKLDAMSVDRCYFSHRNYVHSIAGIGTAVSLSASTPEASLDIFARAQAIVAGTDAVWVGGSAFTGQSGNGHWQDFPAARYVLPLLELSQRHDSCQLSLNLYAHNYATWQSQLLLLGLLRRALRVENPRDQGTNSVVERNNSLSYQDWADTVNQVIGKIDVGELDKVVLAREVKLEMQRDVDVFQLLRRFTLANSVEAIDRSHNSVNNPGSSQKGYVFALEQGESIFFGCSPERLYQKIGQRLTTEALAGTVGRACNSGVGASNLSNDQDNNLAQALMFDPKLILEHRLVAQAIGKSIAPLAMHVSTRAKPDIVKLGSVQHRFQAISAVLMPSIGDAEVYKNLHPTPAVCGYPRLQAQRFIAQTEHFQRGWYSGTVGLISEERTELAVAIRSGLCRGKELWLYSGVGIVKGSEPLMEWQELEVKLTAMLSALEVAEPQLS
ncbi:isochorismate synthase [Teredinibacter waterburyi]|uniref:isochorismate synthase n=1 Tax=Teredinibacter waterburyi TaxID=1500538 RepID=UPI00165F7532|nr:isochorismate synthase [Teredinibacter waterburyi]